MDRSIGFVASSAWPGCDLLLAYSGKFPFRCRKLLALCRLCCRAEAEK